MMNIEDLELAIRSENALKEAGITTVEQLVRIDFDKLCALRNIGNKSVSDICWACIHLLSGRMMEERLKWEERYPLRPVDFYELRNKAEKYDEIVRITNPT